MKCWFRLWVFIAFAAIVAGCGGSMQSSPTYTFLGIAEDETANDGPVGLIDGQAIRVAAVSKVREVSLSDYHLAKSKSHIIAEVPHAGFVYWAVKEERDVHFENATAWVTVLERFKSRLE